MQTKLQSARQRAGVSQTKLAEMADVSVYTLRAYEQGQKDIAKAALATALRIADALGVDVRELLD